MDLLRISAQIFLVFFVFVGWVLRQLGEGIHRVAESAIERLNLK